MYKEGKIMTTGATLLGRGKRCTLLTTLGGILVGSLLCGTTATTAAGMPAGGPIQVFVTPDLSPGSPNGTIVVAGAIGDYGTTLTIDKNGKTDANGDYVKIILKKGGFEINSTKLNALQNKVQPTMNAATCSVTLSVVGPITLFGGTGLYTGISGAVKITETFAFIGPKTTTGAHKGQCNINAQPLAQFAAVTGTGTVKFS